MLNIFTFFKKISVMHSFTTQIGNRGYHGYLSKFWNNAAIHSPVKVMKETNKEYIVIDLYYRNIAVSRLAKIWPVTVGHIQRQISRHIFHFWQERWVNNRICCWYPSSVLVCFIHSGSWVRNSKIDAFYPSKQNKNKQKKTIDKINFFFFEKQLD